jgi:hypothetical protein
MSLFAIFLGLASCLASIYISDKICVNFGLIKKNAHIKNSITSNPINLSLYIISGVAFFAIYEIYNGLISITVNFIFFTLFLINTNIDIKTKYVNDFINILMAIFAIVTGLIHRNFIDFLLSIGIFLAMMIFIYSYQKYKKKEIMGDGDVLMFLSIFSILEIKEISIFLFITGSLSMISFFILFLKNKKITPLPLFPFCFLSYFAVLLMKKLEIIT